MEHLLYHLLPIRRNIIEKNIERVFRDQLETKDVQALCRRFYLHMLTFFAEMTEELCLPSRFFNNHVTLENIDVLERCMEQGKGVLWLSCHLGNWELAFVEFMKAMPHLHGRLSIIRKRLHPQLLNHLIQQRFKRVGIDVLPPERQSIRKILKKLSRNEIVVFVQDQHMSHRFGILTEFFGHPVQFSPSLARLALHTGAPVLPAITWRSKRRQHTCHIGDPIPIIQGDSIEDTVRLSTQRYNEVLESYILAHPEQWFSLAHRLWKVAT